MSFNALAALVLLFSSGMLHAEVVLLKNGQTVSGRIVGQGVGDIQIQTTQKVTRIAKNDIVKIQYVAFTDAQKQEQLDRIRKKREAEAWERERIRRERTAREETERRIKELDERVKAEKEKEAKETSERAAALRELVEKGQMEKPVGEPISYMDFAWRSLIVPGWGHFVIDRPAMGTFYMTASVVLLADAANRYRAANRAVRENHRHSETNFLLTLQPQLAPLEVRVAYGYSSNASAYTGVLHKRDNYYRSLYALEVFYGIQLLHIIYNGIAWENGLLIVGRDPSSGLDAVRVDFAVAPDVSQEGRRGTLAEARLSFHF